MIAYPTLEQILAIHQKMIDLYGGDPGVRDIGLIDSAVAQPRQGFGGDDFYPTLHEKAAALAYFLSKNHGFADGNKRTAYGAMDAFLFANGHEVAASIDETEAVFVGMTDNSITREEFVQWIRQHLVPLSQG